jgi:amidase
MGNESINHLFGRSLNPYNRSLTPAGSSGGEAALLAMKGAPIGLGTDHSGSIRSPAMCCGLYGLRPSWGRVSQKDIFGVFMGFESRRCTSGQMGHSPEDLGLFRSSYMAARPWEMDPEILRMPWQADGVMPAGPLCFAISYGDEDVSWAMQVGWSLTIDDSAPTHHARA